MVHCTVITFSVLIVHLLFANGKSRPNIVVIMADDLGWNDVGFHGSDQIPTPNIDALAYNGIILNRHYTMATCTPSRSAFLTGKYPIRTGMQGRPLKCGEPRGLPLEETILPQRLKNLGYVTRLVGKWHVGCLRSEYTPTRRGFDSHFGYWNGYIGYFDYLIDEENNQYIGYDLHRGLNTSWAENGQYATDVFTREAVNLIAEHDTSQPLFLELAHLAVHSGRDIKLLEVPNTEEALKKFDYIPDTNRRIFAEMTTRLDESVGQIVIALSEKRILNNTIIIFLSDNGAQTVGEHKNWGSNWPLRGLKFTLYEGGLRGVAAVWSSLIQNPGRISSQLMHISDWYPTIYSMAGGDVAELGLIDGINQWPSLTQGKGGEDDEIPRKGTLLNVGDLDDNEAIIDGKWKLIRSTYKNGIYDSFYGAEGRGHPNPSYDTSSIISSPVYKALEPFQGRNNIKENNIYQLRKEGSLNCDGLNRIHSNGPYCPTYCLFDLMSDPCETSNLVLKYPNVSEHLKISLQKFRSEMVPELTKPFSSLADPRYYNNTWVCWLDEEYKDVRLNVTQPNNSISSYNFSPLLWIITLFISLFI